jgi:ABC-type transporter Mla MlaB component
MPTFVVPQTIDHSNVEALIDAITQLANTGDAITVECQALEQFDSSAISLFMAAKRAAKQVTILNAPEKLKSLAQVYGVTEFVTQ